MKRISLMVLAAIASIITATDSAEAGHAANCGCAACRQQAVVQQLYVNYAQAPAFYYQVGEALREEALAQRIIDQLQEPLAQRTADLVSQKLATMGKVTPPAAPPTKPAEPPVAATRDAQVQVIFNRSCVNCHSPTTLNAKPFLNDIAAQKPANPWKLWGLVHTGAMPKKTPAMTDEEFQKAILTDAEVDAVRDWVLELDP